MNNLELDKIKQAGLYLSDKIPDLYFTKFLKLLYYFDFISVLETGQPVTNDTYFNLPYGPVPSFIKDQLSLLKRDIKESEEKIIKDDPNSEKVASFFDGLIELEDKTTGSVLVKKVEPDLNYLSEYEKDLLDDIIDEFKGTSTADLVKKTHSEAPYNQTTPSNIIGYKMAFYLDRNKILPKRTYEFDSEISQAEFFNE